MFKSEKEERGIEIRKEIVVENTAEELKTHTERREDRERYKRSQKENKVR